MSERKIDWVNTLFLTLTPPAAIGLTLISLAKEGFYWHNLVLFWVLYLFSGLSITAGYHRLFSHKTYDANPLIKLFYLIFGAATFQNSCLKWSTDHRRHHSHVDTEKDPYNINQGFWYAHIGWVMLKEKPEYRGKFVPDLSKDPLVRWQHNNYLAISILAGFVLPFLIGLYLGTPLGALAIAGFARVVFVHHGTFLINSLCHTLGKQPYTDRNTARDHWFTAFFTFGEGYHNFHHFFQVDYRNGIRWYQFDPTKWLIYSCSKLGLARGLKRTPDEEIKKACLKMERKKVFLKLQSIAILEDNLRLIQESAAMLEEKLQSIAALRKELTELKLAKTNAAKLRFAELHSSLRQQYRDYYQELAQWRKGYKVLLLS